MDTFLGLAKKGYDAYSESQSGVSKTGGQELNSPNHSQQDGSTGATGPEYDHNEAVETASKHGSGDSSLFSTAMGYLNQNKGEHGKPLDEQQVQDAHHTAYNQDSPGSLDATSIGSAAALQVLKQFTSGQGGGSQSQTQLISFAMAEASTLFDKSGGAAGGTKQDAVNGAAMTVTKLLVQSKFSAMTGGGNSGGLSSLMGMFLK